MAGCADKFMLWQVVILVGAGAFAWWVFYAPEGVRSAIEEMAAPITGFCGSAFGWVQDKISGESIVPRSFPFQAGPLQASFSCVYTLNLPVWCLSDEHAPCRTASLLHLYVSCC